MTQELATIDAQQKEILLNTICKGVSTEDFLFMLELAKKYQLDPFAKQIYATKVGIIISRDGLLAIAHRSGDFDGMQTTFEHDDKGNIISSTTTVWRKNISHPFVETAFWNEYAKDSAVWKQYKHAMMQKCSERMALSKAYAITGLYAEEELSQNPRAPEDIRAGDYIDVEPLPTEPKMCESNSRPQLSGTITTTKSKTSPAEPQPTPKHVYTKEQVEGALANMRTIGMNTDGLLEKARLPDGLYNGDLINEEWQRQQKARK